MRVNVTPLPAIRAGCRRSTAAAVAAAAAISLLPASAIGQAGLTNVDDAAPVPAGMVRLRIVPSWERYDARFTGSGAEPLGAVLTSAALGTTEIPALVTLEAALRNLTGDPDFRVSLGQSVAVSSVRAVTTPFTLEYGVTRRFSLAVTVPVVQRQREFILDIRATGETAGNVGPTAARVDPQVYARAAEIAQQVEMATDRLVQRLAECTAQPEAPDCGPINANQGDVLATIDAGRRLAASVHYVYGTSATAPGFGLVPRTELADAIGTRLQQLNARFATYLGGTPVPAQTPPRGAAGAAASGDVRALARAGAAGIGPDSLGRVDKIGIGDVEISARFVAWESRGSPPVPGESALVVATRPRLRVMAGALARLGTGSAPSDDEYFVPGAGDGQTDIEGHVAADLEGPGRLGGTVLVRYTAQLGSVAATRLPDAQGFVSPFGPRGTGERTLGNVLTLEASPRYRLGNAFYIGGHYALLARAADTYSFVVPDEDPGFLPAPAAPRGSHRAGAYTEHRAGVGLTYSTMAAWERGRVRLPLEVSYAHIETFGGSSALVPRAGRDQIQVRLYYRVRR